MSDEYARQAIERIERSCGRSVAEAYLFRKKGRTHVVFCYTIDEDDWRYYSYTPTTTIVHKVGIEIDEALAIVAGLEEK
jgi:hypothetical protein